MSPSSSFSFLFICFILFSKQIVAQVAGSLPSIPTQPPTPTPSSTISNTILPTSAWPTTTESTLLAHQAQGTYLTNCDWCYGHFSLCHQPTGAPDSQIYSQCYCNTFFQAVYTGCVHDCGWSQAGIPPLADITNTCNADNAANSGDANGSPGPTPAATPAAGDGSQQSTAVTFTTVVKTASQPKNTVSENNGNSNGNGNRGSSGSDATSGVDDKDDDHGILFRVESVIISGVAVLWIAGWL